MEPLNPRAVFKACTRFLNWKVPTTSHPETVLKELAQSATPDDRADFFGDGGMVAAFEKQIAELLGKEAALFVPTGVMAQQLALRVWTDRRGCRNVVFHPTCHLEKHEEKAYERLHGLHAILTGTPDNPNALVRRSSLEAVGEPIGAVLIELPQRWIGGVLLPWDELVDLSAWAREKSVPLHMDGARLWECQPYYQKSCAEISALFDSVYVSFYKGLGALSGAALAGPADFIREAKVWRRRHGGALFHLYPYVASARSALAQRLPRMQQYHEAAVAIAAELAKVDGIEIVPNPPHTNMMHLYLRAAPQRLQTAQIELAHETKVWLFPGLFASPIPNHAMLELTVGDATLELAPKEVGELFRELMRRASSPA